MKHSTISWRVYTPSGPSVEQDAHPPGCPAAFARACRRGEASVARQENPDIHRRRCCIRPALAARTVQVEQQYVIALPSHAKYCAHNLHLAAAAKTASGKSIAIQTWPLA
jgi:hypothetical protein